MPTFLLCIKADLENIAELKIDPMTARWCLTVKDTQSDEERQGIYVTATETQELSGSKGTANFKMKWDKQSKHECYINVETVKNVTRSYTVDDSENHKFVPIVAFECRGLEPIGFHPENDFSAVSTGGAKFEEVDLSEKEWCDFDEKANETVGIYNFEYKFELNKNK